MIKRDPTNDRLVSLFLLGALLLLPPLLLVFNKPVRFAGIPVLYLYLFVAWALVIGFSALIARRIEARAPPPVAQSVPASPPDTEEERDA